MMRSRVVAGRYALTGVLGRGGMGSVYLAHDRQLDRDVALAQGPAHGQAGLGLVAQDVQDALLERVGRWPLCTACADDDVHPLYIHPELGGPDPHWVCEHSGTVIAPLGGLAR